MSRKRRSPSARVGTGTTSRPAQDATLRPGRPSEARPAGARPSRPARPARRRSQTWILVGGAALILVASIAAVVLGQGSGTPTGPAAFRSPTPRAPASTAASATPKPAATVDPRATGFPTIDGVACDPDEQVTYHVHAHLNIRIEGVLETIPGDVGQRPSCLYWLHTHQPFGVIHIEAPVPTAFTLGQFFDVWGKPLDATRIGDWTVPAGSKMWLFLDGKPITGDPRAIALTDLASIEIQVGPAALDPLPYTFPADFG